MQHIPEILQIIENSTNIQQTTYNYKKNISKFKIVIILYNFVILVNVQITCKTKEVLA